MQTVNCGTSRIWNNKKTGNVTKIGRVKEREKKDKRRVTREFCVVAEATTVLQKVTGNAIALLPTLVLAANTWTARLLAAGGRSPKRKASAYFLLSSPT